MNSIGFKTLRLGLAAGLLMIVSCSPMPLIQADKKVEGTPDLTASEQIAGEIMAYLMEVVLGKAGAPQMRAQWATRGSELPLDFSIVKNRMFGPVPLRAELMVLDTNILGVSQVLYHYDRRLNLFKGEADHDSLYPCAELIAIRLLLVHKLKRGERVSMAAIIRQKALFQEGGRDPQPAELAEMNLTLTEFRFLRDILQSEPAFLRYMQHPFLISTLKRIGVAQQDTVSLLADQMTNYRRWSAPGAPSQARPTVSIAILASMTTLFQTTNEQITGSDAYRQLVGGLEHAIVSNLEQRTGLGARPTFTTPNHPMVIHPQNAGRVIEDVCPQADFVVIVLGKNVYRAMHIDPEMDVYPHERRIYLDVSDIRYGRIDDEINSVVDAVLPMVTGKASTPVS